MDISKLTAHSTRAAASSYLVSNNVGIDEIMKYVGWSSKGVFQRFYNKPSEDLFNFGDAVLETIIRFDTN